MSWVRVNECRLCGNDRCVVSSENVRMGYCFRFGQTYFVKPDGYVVKPKGTGSQAAKRKNKEQESFDFDDDLPDHLDALSS